MKADVVYCTPSFLLVLPFAINVYFLYTLGCSFGASFLYVLFCFVYQEKKKFHACLSQQVCSVFI